jgi:hypothetical protein
MSWPTLPIIPRRLLPRWSVRQLVAKARFYVSQSLQGELDKAVDRIVDALVGRKSVRRLVDDLVRSLIANPAVYELVDDIVEYISVQPAVRDLVQSQGAHLTDEVIDESREHLYRADAFCDEVVASTRKRLRITRARPGRATQRSR